MSVGDAGSGVIKVSDKYVDSKGWLGQKTPWMIERRYAGPILVRGQRLDEPGPVRFAKGAGQHFAELRFAAGERNSLSSRFRGLASASLFRSAGCYGFQVDGTSFSRVIVMRVFDVPAEGELISPAGYSSFDGTPGAVPVALRRPLDIPVLRKGARCPVSAPGKVVSPYYGAAIGKGPIYGISLVSLADSGVLSFDYPPGPNSLFAGSLWGGQALKWLADPTYTGPVLIRGLQLDGQNRLGFGNGPWPFSEMQLAPGEGDPQAGGWRGWGGYARFRAPGCYGVQVDGTNFSEVIVLRAKISG
jgi:hypothetical protein